MREALQILIEERDRLNRAIDILQAESTPTRSAPASSGPKAKKASKKRRKRSDMSAEQKAAVSARMKKYWAQRRKAKAKGK